MSTARRILITGAASGLGKALALQCASGGWRIAVCDRDQEGIERVSAEIEQRGGEVLSCHVDVKIRDQLQAAADRVEREWGGIDVLINNAGIAGAGRTDETTTEDLRYLFDVNFFAVVECTQIMLPLIERGGHIVNVASFAGIASAPGMISYNTAKAAVISFSESLRAELHDQEIGVSVACPFFFQTNLLSSLRAPHREARDTAAKLMRSSPVSADDVARQILAATDNRRFMLIAHTQARWGWRIKRWFPETWHRQLCRVTRRYSATQAPGARNPGATP